MLALRSLLTRCMKMPDKMLSNIYGKKSAQFVQTFAVHRKLLQLKRILCVGFLEVSKLLDEKNNGNFAQTSILHLFVLDRQNLANLPVNIRRKGAVNVSTTKKRHNEK